MSDDIRASELKQPIDVAEYLFRRLHELGVCSVHGVPGDYNLVALDYIPKCGLNWVGNCNELNAGMLGLQCSRVSSSDNLQGMRQMAMHESRESLPSLRPLASESCQS